MEPKKNKKKTLIIIICSVVAALVLAVAIPFSIFGIRTSIIKKDYGYLRNDPTYSKKVEISGLDLVTQHISCGYATIEMMSSYYGNKVSEDDLSSKNGGRITTSASRGFLKEINNSIPNKGFVMHAYLNNDALLKEIVVSLNKNNPVAIEWAAYYENQWTLHFSIVSGIDLANDKVTIYNPYGLIENITTSEFISRTSFESYGNMPLFLSFGFAFGAFHKNTLFFATI